ncbi:oligosaccharide flippase family protein [Sphingobacterium mizutaii]|uniref:oligosaccharide flippase family protein n=1 Tax=Sphingobacterium mizutaii TaxID=1010 RepID=UPI00162864F9|nr:oligosaccharide flippase family protein [Sphingobacterium mizutaii]
MNVSNHKNLLSRIKLEKEFIKRSILLLSSTLISLVFGFLTNSMLTKLLGKELYGDYALIVNIFTFCQILFNLGLYYTLSRLVAITNDENKIRGYYFVGIILTFGLFFLMSISLVLYGYFSNNFNNKNLLYTFFISIPFSWLFLFTTLNEFFLQGVSKIKLLSISRVLPKVLFAIFLILWFFKDGVNLNWVLLMNYITLLITYVYVYLRIKPSKLYFFRRLKEVIVANKQFGFDIYLGALIASGSGSLSGILIGQFGINNVEVGFFTLATLLSSPLSIIPNIIATVQFKQFAKIIKIPFQTIGVTIGICIFFLFFIWLFSEPLVLAVFGEEYFETIEILKFLSIGYLMYGLGDFYNRFLLAKGKGRELRNASIIVGVTLLIANVVFIKYLGGIGAAYARIISGFMYTLVILYYYFKETK